ncbi:hypothetical protein HWC01_gp78 [Pseudomonas phage vB_PaeM_SCUT-S1]|uniref:Uncharacterized protein n=1 Tax=Pseudomonas phage vB_PaeM_SCUT-S1 TaxID=2508865 RepID=A0A410T8H4_9CAUD|nr:hypothetical protein HWC01_gp78 [Pseudomonas phage vB_PaeM_SCUT-S1]QAU05256.1 hypothetical protein S1_078 [Pseudomonas phage vB_PaeM_SCUT-S1]
MLRNCVFEVVFSWEIAANYCIAILSGNLGSLLPRGLAGQFPNFRFFEHGLKLFYSENRLHNPNRKNLSRTLPIFKINKINSNLVIWYTLVFESLAALSLYISRQVSDSSPLAAGSPETSGLPIHGSRQHHGGLSGKCQTRRTEPGIWAHDKIAQLDIFLTFDLTLLSNTHHHRRPPTADSILTHHRRPPTADSILTHQRIARITSYNTT